MQTISQSFTRIKWVVIAALLIWGSYLWVSHYALCRADGTNNIGCALISLFTAYLAVLLNIFAYALAFFGYVLP